jgi:hypothetical protein
MSGQSKRTDNQSHEGIDDIIDDAVENAEARKELSNDEMDEIAGGIKLPLEVGIIANNNFS